MPAQNTQYSAKIKEKTQLTDDVFEIKLEKPKGFSYSAGQFIQFLFADQTGKTVKRPYSLSSKPTDQDLELCVKCIPGGVASEQFRAARIGDTLTFLSPKGFFINSEEQAPLCFVATGVGLAPIYSILQDELITKKNTNPMRLHFGVRSEKDIFWIERLETLDRDYPNFSYKLTLSQPSPTWDSHAGRVTAHVPGEHHEQQFFLCGSMEMVKDVRSMLLEKGADAKAVHFEIF